MKGERPCLGVSGEPSPPREPRARTPAPQPALTRVRSPPAQPLHREGTLVTGNRRQLTFQTWQGWCWCTPPPERTHDPTSGAPASGRGRRPGPSPSPAFAINWKQPCTSGASGALSPEGTSGKALAVGDFGCLSPPPGNLPKWSC